MHKKQQVRRGVVFACAVLIGVFALQQMLAALESPDQQVQQLVQRLFAIGGLGSVVVMGIASLMRFDRSK